MVESNLIQTKHNSNYLLIHPKPAEIKIQPHDLPPCPNGCGNLEIHKITREQFNRLNGMSELSDSPRRNVTTYLFLCERCMGVSYVRIAKDVRRVSRQ